MTEKIAQLRAVDLGPGIASVVGFASPVVTVTSFTHHQRAELLMAEAEMHERLGDYESARRYYEQAAEQEAQAFRTLEGAGERTRSVLALSAVALYSRAGNHADGIHLAYEVLAAQRLLPAATTEIEEVLDDLRNPRAAAELGLNRVSDHLEWVLRGPGVGAGMATLDAISQKIGQIERLGVRVYEFILAHPLRRHGPPAWSATPTMRCSDSPARCAR